MDHDDRLDELLALAREPEPEDDGFTEETMLRIRRSGGRSGVRRWMTRPVLLAAAVLMLAGGALAAVSTVTPSNKGSDGALPVDLPLPTDKPSVLPTRPPSGEPPTKSPRPTPPGGGEYQHGYDSQHTAWGSDGQLKLTTESYVNAAKVGEPRKVTLTVTNVSDQPVYVSVSSDCPLGVYASRGSEGSVDDRTGATTVNGKEGARFCAGGDGPRTQEGADTAAMQPAALEPGQSYSADVTVGFKEEGDWQLVGVCSCYRKSAPPPSGEPRPTAKPTAAPGAGPIIRPLAIGEPTVQPAQKAEPRPTAATTYESRSETAYTGTLFTPPITITVSA